MVRCHSVLAERLLHPQFEHLLGAGCERKQGGGDLIAPADDVHDLRPCPVKGDAKRLEHTCGKAVLLAEQAEQDVLGADIVVPEVAGFLLRTDDYAPGLVCEALEHAPQPTVARPAPLGSGLRLHVQRMSQPGL